jgi:hypothetical protein
MLVVCISLQQSSSDELLHCTSHLSVPHYLHRNPSCHHHIIRQYQYARYPLHFLGKRDTNRPLEASTTMLKWTVALYLSHTNCQMFAISNAETSAQAFKELRRQRVRSISQISDIQRNKSCAYVSDSATNGGVKAHVMHCDDNEI